MALSSGDRLGRYEILSALGAGGMGEVYRARDQKLGRAVAIKVLPDRLSGDAESRARFEREARAVATVTHPNILAIHDVGEDRGVFFVVTELLDGETLRWRLMRERVAWRRAVEIGSAIAEGLAAAHGRGVVHRDLKPDNIFLTSDGSVKILDFGLAQVTAPSENFESSTPTNTMKTEAGTVLGTIGYMAPEQVTGEAADARSDIFALGCVLYELLEGRRAFSRRSPGETMAAILRDPAPELSEGSGPLPSGLDRIVRRCLEKNPDERFQSARDLAFDLRRLTQAEDAPSGPSGVRRPTIDSIAVLPLANLSGDPDAEYLSDGIADSILQGLSKLPGLRVMPRSGLSRYKGRDFDPQQVGRELGVRAILTGRVFHRGEALAIKAELLDTRDGSVLWAESYNRRLSDILAVEEEISRVISEKLRLRVTGEEAERLTRRATENAESHRLFLKARFFTSKRSAEGMRKAIELFHGAIELDPEYGLAYAGIADAYNQLGFYNYLAPVEAFPKAKAAAARALELDPSASDARAALAYTQLYFDRDWRSAEENYRSAIAASPGSASAHHYYAVFLAARKRWEECFSNLREAEQIDPLSLPIRTAIGLCLYMARRFDEAIAHLEKTAEMDGTFLPAPQVLGWSLVAKGAAAEGIAELEKTVELSGGGSFFLASLAYSYGVAGRGLEAEEILSRLEAESRRCYVSSYNLAAARAALGQKDRAFACLEEAVDERAWMLVFLGVDPKMDPLRDDPRFEALRRRVEGPPGPPETPFRA